MTNVSVPTGNFVSNLLAPYVNVAKALAGQSWLHKVLHVVVHRSMFMIEQR